MSVSFHNSNFEHKDFSLAIAREIVALHHGTIQVSERQNKQCMEIVIAADNTRL